VHACVCVSVYLRRMVYVVGMLVCIFGVHIFLLLHKGTQGSARDRRVCRVREGPRRSAKDF
jgi:hypothetical protein